MMIQVFFGICIYIASVSAIYQCNATLSTTGNYTGGFQFNGSTTGEYPSIDTTTIQDCSGSGICLQASGYYRDERGAGKKVYRAIGYTGQMGLYGCLDDVVNYINNYNSGSGTIVSLLKRENITADELCNNQTFYYNQTVKITRATSQNWTITCISPTTTAAPTTTLTTTTSTTTTPTATFTNAINTTTTYSSSNTQMISQLLVFAALLVASTFK